MRYVKPHFYDSFVCTAGDCPDTCCAGWEVDVDKKSSAYFSHLFYNKANVNEGAAFI